MQQLKEANSKAGPPAATRSSPPAKLPRPPYKKLKKDGFAQLGDQAAQDLLASEASSSSSIAIKKEHGVKDPHQRSQTCMPIQLDHAADHDEGHGKQFQASPSDKGVLNPSGKGFLNPSGKVPYKGDGKGVIGRKPEPWDAWGKVWRFLCRDPNPRRLEEVDAACPKCRGPNGTWEPPVGYPELNGSVACKGDQT